MGNNISSLRIYMLTLLALVLTLVTNGNKNGIKAKKYLAPYKNQSGFSQKNT